MLAPEFVMPPEAAASPSPGPPSSRRRSVASDPAADPTADRDDVVLTHERLPWRQLVIVALVGVLLGSSVPAVLQQADRAAAVERVESLRSTAQRYLDAIAHGDAALATAIAPLEGDTAPARALRTADPISGAQVRSVLVDERAGIVEVAYQVGSARERQTIAADRADGAWRLTTSLAEPVVVHAPDGWTSLRVGGVELPASREVMLYPGRYQVDRVSGPMLRSGGERFEVDGDPESSTELHTSIEPSERLGAAATAVAASRVEACEALPECPIGQYTVVATHPVAPEILRIDPEGAIDLVVLLGLDAASGGRRQELHLRVIPDAAGSTLSWECGEIDRPHRDLEPCTP